MKPIDDMSEREWLDLVQEAASLPAAPAAAVRAALELWRDHAPAPPLSLGAHARRWVAALTFDSWALSPVEYGVRGAGQGRHMLFAAAGSDIDLRIVPLAAGFAVNGQHLGSAARGFVRWQPMGDPAAAAARSVELNPNGEFTIEGVDSGTYVLELVLNGAHAIELPPISLGVPGGAR